MKNTKISALILCAAMALSASVSCEKDSNKNTSGTKDSVSDSVDDYTNPGNNQEATKNVPETPTTNREIGENKIPAEIQSEASANDTVFKLNSILDAGVQGSRGCRYIYPNVEITNTSDEDYTLSSLNNIYINYGDVTYDLTSLATMLFARGCMTIDIIQDPIIVPAHGTFSGYITGFEVPTDVDSFTIGFFPTQNDERNKSTTIEVEITADDIQKASEDMFKEEN